MSLNLEEKQTLNLLINNYIEISVLKENSNLITFLSENIEIFKILIKNNKEIINFLNENLEIFKKLIKNNEEIINFLLDFNPEIYIKILKISIEEKNLNIIKLINNKNFNINYQNNNLLRLACISQDIEIIKYLIENNFIIDDNSLLISFLNNNLEIFKYLIDNGGNPFCHDKYILLKLIYDNNDNNNIEIINYLNKNIEVFNYFLTVYSLDNNIEMVHLIIKNRKKEKFENNDSLINCIRNNNIELLIFLINNNNKINKKYKIIIKYLINTNNIETIKLLLDIDNINSINNFKILKVCSKYGLIEIFNYLIEKGIKLNLYPKILLFASKYSYIEIIKLLINNIESKEYYNDALINAIKPNNLEIIKYLIEKGADINYDSSKILMKAIKLSDNNIIKYLIDNGGNIKANNNYILKYCCKYNKCDLFNYFNYYDIDDYLNMMIIAVDNNNIDILKLLINNSNNKINNYEIIDYYLLLNKAIKYNNINIIKILIEYIDINSENAIQLLFELVYNNKNIEIIKLILEKGIIITNIYKNLLFNSIKNNNIELFDYLFLKYGDFNSYNIILFLINNNKKDILEYILNKKITIIDEENLILITTIRYLNLDIIKLLYKYKYKIHNNNNNNILLIAFKLNNLEIFKYLIDVIGLNPYEIKSLLINNKVTKNKLPIFNYLIPFYYHKLTNTDINNKYFNIYRINNKTNSESKKLYDNYQLLKKEIIEKSRLSNYL